MVSRRSWLALAAFALLAGGCQILSYTLLTPASVAPGRVFTMRLMGVTDSGLGQVGVVFQVPNGFTVLGASVTATVPVSAPLVSNDPSLLALYTPDPNHHLASFSGTTLTSHPPATIGIDLKIYVRASPTPGPYQFEMALAAGSASGFTPQLGLGSFQAPGGSVVRPLQVAAAPAPPPFALSAVVFAGGAVDVEAADIDGDGRDDLLHLAYSNVGWLRSVPGAFVPGGVLPGGSQLFDAEIADFDGDGFQDVALSSGTVLFGDGGTTWTPVVAVAATGIAVGAGDVDGDGRADLAWSGTSTFTVLRGQANRTFVPWDTGLAATGPVASPNGIDVVDLDSDGRAEIVVARFLTAPRVYRHTAGGVWSLVGSMPGQGDVLVIDVDGDGVQELVPSGAGQMFTYTPQGLVALGTAPGGTFSQAVALDFDRDGREDFALGFGTPVSPGPRMELWRNTGSGFQQAPLPPATGFEVQNSFAALVGADFDDDTFPDLAAMTDQVLAWHNTHQGVAPFGEPCAAIGGAPPDLAVIGSVAPGQSAVVQLANAAPLGGALLWLGTSRTLWNGQAVLPLHLATLGAPGCVLLAEPLVLVGVIADGSGVASLPVTVPLVPPHVDVAVFLQGAVLAPAANPLGVVFSRGLALKIQ